MKKTMKTAVMTALKKIEIQDREIPEIAEDEVLIKVKDVGICGSDIHYYEYGNIGDFVVEPPFVLGHESGGEIVEIGSAVEGFEIGENVAIEPGIPCGKCEFCTTGNYHLCPDVVFLATPPYDGVFQEYINYPAHMVYQLPDNVTTEEGALVEPLNVALHALELSDAKIGQSAMVFGCGCIGLLTIASLKAAGITEIYATDIIPKRIEQAKAMGAKVVWNGKETDVIHEIKKLTHNKGVDAVFETAGSKITTQQTIAAVAKGGTIVVTGMAPDPTIPLDIITLVSKEAKMEGQFRYKNLYPKAIKLISEGLIDVKRVVSDRCSLEELPKMMDKSVKDKANIIKTVVHL